MRKKSGLTIVEQAIVLVPEFENVVRKLGQQVTLRGQSKSTLQNYIRRIALFVARFGKLPELYNHTAKRNQWLQFTPEEKPGIDTLIKRQQPTETNLQKLVRLTGFDPCLCPVCKAGRMVVTRGLPRIRSPAGFLPSHFCPQF